MARTQLKGSQVEDGNITRQDLNVATPGSAVARRILPGRGIRLESTGADSGTGDVTIHADGPILDREIAGTADTPTSADIGVLLRTMSNSATTITLLGSGFTTPMTSFPVLQEGTGQITFVAGASNEIVGVGPFRSRAQGTGQVIMYLGDNKWWVTGELESAASFTPSAGVTSINGLTSIPSGRFLYTTGVDTFAAGTITAAGRALLDDADASAQRTTLGLAIGSNVQAYSGNLDAWSGLATTAKQDQSANLDAWSAITTASKQNANATLSAIAALTIGNNQSIYVNGSGVLSVFTLTAAGLALLDDADATAQRATLGLVIGTNVQAYSANLAAWSALATSAKQDTDAGLTSIAGLTTSAGTSIYTTAADTYATYATSASGRNLSNIGGTSGSMAYLSGTDTWGLVATTAGGRALLNAAGTANTLPYYSATNTVSLAAVTAAGLALLDDTDATAQRATLGLVIGTNVQAYSANLAAWSALATSAKQDSNATLTAVAGLTFANNTSFYVNNSGVAATYALSAFALTLLDDADAAAVRYTLGLGTVATLTYPGGTSTFLRADGTWAVPAGEGVALSAGLTSMNSQVSIPADRMWYTTGTDTFALGTITAAGRAILDDADATAQRTTLGLAIGTNVQAYNAALASIAGLTTSAGTSIYTTASNTYATYATSASGRALSNIGGTSGNIAYLSGADTWSLTAITADGRSLIGAADYAAMRTALGLVIGTNVQAYSANLAAWSALATSAKQDSNAGLTSIAGLTTSAGTSIYTTASNVYATYATSASGRALSNIGGTSGSAPYLSGTDAWALAATTAGGRALWNVAGTANTYPYFSSSNTVTLGTIGTIGINLLAAPDTGTAHTAIGLSIGTHVQAYSANLSAIANLTYTAGSTFWLNASGTPAVYSLTTFATTLLDDPDAATMRATLGITSIATITLPGGSTNFLREDGTWAAPAGGGGSSTLTIQASANLTAGQLVNVHSASSAARVRPANATAVGSEANGFVLANVTSGADATVYKPGDIITGLSGLTADANYWLSTTGGGITATPPSTAGNVVQYVGRALSTTSLYFNPQMPITVS